MKKIIFNLLVYTFFAGVVCFFAGMFIPAVPVLNESDVLPYRLNNGFLFVLNVMPSVILTGFLIGTAIAFRDEKVSVSARFSSGILKCFRYVLVISLFLTFGLSMCHDIGVPVLKQRKIEFEGKPHLINSYLELAQSYLIKSLKNSEYTNLSSFYSKKVLELDPKNQKAMELQKRAELAAALKKSDKTETPLSENSALPNSLDFELEPVDTSEIFKIQSSSVYELVTEAEKLFEKDDFLAAHYYAQMAVKIADGRDTNLSKAKEIANKAWNILSHAQAEKLTEENLFFRKKLEGYKKLIAGDFLSSYYIFQRLNNSSFEKSRDPDVKRYLNIARYELTQEYFFMDESDDKDTFESAENVYFSLPHNDGTYDVFFIKGITDINQAGEFVRYLRELSIYSFDAYGNFSSSMTVPYAKMLAVSTDSLSEQQKINSGIEDSWKMVPYIMLCSVDRDREGKKVSPVYLSKNAERIEGPNQILLSMPFNDFSVLSKCSGDNPKMSFFNMTKMKLPPSAYGYSQEIIMQTILTSIFYPFMILILLIFSACIGWNYRLQGNGLFKFIWIFIFPFVNLILYGVVDFAVFFIKLMNFILIGFAGVNFSMYAGLAFYSVCLIFVCILFLSRKGD
ncbi:MAG: hypothetical protein ACI4LX_09350 [Treponema sp.]